MCQKLTHLSLFSGIGGIDLAAEWAGFESIGQCEMNEYARKVLQKNFGNMPRWGDVRDVTKGSVWEECKTNKITLLSGGFPCQPFSCAGKQRGKDDDRYLWPEMFRVVRELRPTWILGENVAGFINMGLDTALSDLESAGYETKPFILPACGVGALHKRDRCFIVAHCNGESGYKTDQTFNTIGKKWGAWYNACSRDLRCTTAPPTDDVANPKGVRCGSVGLSIRTKKKVSLPSFNGEYVSDPCGERCKECHATTITSGPRHNTRAPTQRGSKWETEPAVGRVVDGVPHRVDRLRCLGNAVVPQQVYPILQAIADIERGITCP